MKTIRAFRCIRGASPGRATPASPVCILLDEQHAKHTLRTFLRGQGSSAVVEPIPDIAVSRLLGSQPAAESPAEPTKLVR